MKTIAEIYKNAARPVFSFEFFPPKTSEGEAKLYVAIEELKTLQPDFVSVTYGAGGSTREKTFAITEKIIKDAGLVAAAHFTSVGATRDEIAGLLLEMKSRGIDNIIALRGDPPYGQKSFDVSKSAFAHADELVSFIRSKGFDFGLGGACYPEKHPEAESLVADIRNLKKKVDAGVEFLLTQLFFVNSLYLDFVKLARQEGIKVPIVPGIMPVTNFGQIERFRTMAGCRFPEAFVSELEKYQNDEKRFLDVSLEFTISQCEELIKNGAPGIHFYTLNQSSATLQILKELKKKLLQK